MKPLDHHADDFSTRKTRRGEGRPSPHHTKYLLQKIWGEGKEERRHESRCLMSTTVKGKSKEKGGNPI